MTLLHTHTLSQDMDPGLRRGTDAFPTWQEFPKLISMQTAEKTQYPSSKTGSLDPVLNDLEILLYNSVKIVNFAKANI